MDTSRMAPEMQPYATKVMDILNKQKDHVRSVTFLENFNKDMETSLHYGKDIYRGVVVNLAPEYKLSEEDTAWMHPHMCQTTGIYPGGTFQAVEEGFDALAKFNAVCGTYNVHSIDEIGTPVTQTYTIVQTYSEDDAQDLHRSLQGLTVREAYNQIMTKEVDQCTNLREKTATLCDNLASGFTSEDRLFNQYTNSFFKAADGIQFHNYSLPPAPQRLVMLAPLQGFKLVKTGGSLPADLLSSKYFDINNMSSQQQKRVFVDCQSQSREAFNTFTMRKALACPYEGQSYIMQKACFSSTPIHDKLSPADKFKLTPKVVPVDTDVFDHIKEGNIKIKATSHVIQKLLGVQDIQILNPKYYKDNSLYIPRQVLKQIL